MDMLARDSGTDQLLQHVDEVVVHCAAQAAIVQHHDLLILSPLQVLLRGYQLAVYVDLAKLRSIRFVMYVDIILFDEG